MRTITDIDVLAFRFPRGLPLANPRKRAPQDLNVSDIDPGLGVPDDSIDMIIGEVKEGRVGVNTGVRDPEVLNIVIGRLPAHLSRHVASSAWDTCSSFCSPTYADTGKCCGIFSSRILWRRRGGVERGRGEGGVELVPSSEPRRRHDVTPRHMQRYGPGRRK